MFNAREAFSKLEGRTFQSFLHLKDELKVLRIEHLRELPPGTGPEALYDLAMRNGWVKSTGQQITISTATT